MGMMPQEPSRPDVAIVAAAGLQKSFGTGSTRVQALAGVDLIVKRGEFLAVMGPSGSGKSTLLHLLGLMTPADAGSIELDGRLVPSQAAARNTLRRTKIGFIFQRFNLLSMLSAVDNVAISLRVRGLKLNRQVEQLFQEMGVSHVLSRKCSQMSVGEQQRLAVVRAMAHRPALLLADEPTGNLDSQNASALLNLLRRMNRQFGQSIVMITHSAEAAGYADRIVHMKDGRLLDPNR